MTNMFVVTKVLAQQAYSCHDKRVCCNKLTFVMLTFVMTKEDFCHDKLVFVMTNTFVKRLLQQKFCHNKHTFVMTKEAFCHDKHVFVMTNTFVMTKMILVAAPTNDRERVRQMGTSQTSYLLTVQNATSSLSKMLPPHCPKCSQP